MKPHSTIISRAITAPDVHDLDKAEGCKPEIITHPVCSFATNIPAEREQDEAEGEQPDFNFILSALRSDHPCASAEVEAADMAMKQAQRNLVQAVKTAYPIGSRLSVSVGANTLVILVTGHCNAWWSKPGYIHGDNCKTGKPRSFHHSTVVEVLND